jgi:hypothetical protein
MQRHKGFSPYNWGPSNLTVKVTNSETGRVDIHKYLSRDEADWINISPNLQVEIIEASMRRVRRKRDA